MRSRTPQPFPFNFQGSAPGAEWEPISLTLKEAVRLWHRTLSVSAEFEFEGTYDGVTRTFTKTITATRKRPSGYTTDFSQGEELDLLNPNSYAYFYGQTANEAIAPWGGSDPSHPAIEEVYFRVALSAFDKIGSWRRGRFGGVEDIAPNIQLEATMFVTYASGPLVVDGYLRGTSTETAGAVVGSSIFGADLSLGLTSNEGLTGGGFPEFNGLTCTFASCLIEQAGSFEYRDADGLNPVWDASTGARLLDPLDTSVP